MKTHYETLGVSVDENNSQYKKAILSLGKKIYHPDKHSGTNKNAQFKQLSEAYSTLSNPKKYIYTI